MHRMGFHVSISGSISNSIKNAENIKCTAFQIFTRNPRGWAAKPLDINDVEEYKRKINSSFIDKNDVVVHMPYLPNLAAPENDFYFKSRNVLAEEIIRCSTLGIPYVILHLGSHLGTGTSNGITQIVNACNYAIDNYTSSYERHLPVNILLENSAGQKNSIGQKFEEIKIILEQLDNKKIGVCFDTCHAFSSGYDLRTSENVIQTLDIFNDTIGIRNLKILHLNDSKGDFNQNKDRHEHIGLGSIGKVGFQEILGNKYVKNIPIIMETPVDKIRGDKENMEYVLQLLESSTSE
jgi:deoxyribonuclease IV